MPTEVSGAQRSQPPYGNVGLLIATWASGERSAATAVLVGRNDVLTAAHALYNPARGGWAAGIEVHFGADYDFTLSTLQDPGNTVRTTRWSATAFVQRVYADADNSTFSQSESQFDLALVGVDTPIGDRIGWLPLAPGYNTAQSAEAVGYPSDGTGMMAERVSVTSSSVYSLYESPVSVFGPGSSGGPLLVGGLVIGIKSTSAWWADLGGATVYGALMGAMATNDAVLDAGARPTATSMTPANGAISVPTSTNLSIRFSEMIKRGVGTITLETAGGRMVESFDAATSARVTIQGDTLTLDPTQDLEHFTSYKVTLPDGAASSLAGRASSARSDYGFYTGGILIDGSAGDDRFVSTSAVEEFNGGAGTDTAVYPGSIDGYRISIDRPTRTTTVIDRATGRSGADLLRDVEKLQFGPDVFDLFNPARTSKPAHEGSRDLLFDASYYVLAHSAQTRGLNLESASAHYFASGAAAGLRPNAWFDPVYYAVRWPDLRQDGFDSATLFAHYNLYGVWEGRSAGPLHDRLDGTRYLRDNPDVAAYVDTHVSDFAGSRTNGALAHYLIYGAAEGRAAYEASGEWMSAVIVIGMGG